MPMSALDRMTANRDELLAIMRTYRIGQRTVCSGSAGRRRVCALPAAVTLLPCIAKLKGKRVANSRSVSLPLRMPNRRKGTHSVLQQAYWS